MAKNETIVKDRGAAKILVELKKLEKKPFVKVGVPAEKAEAHDEGDGLTNIDLAFIHEFGTIDAGGNIPERSHIRAAFDQAKQELNSLTEKLHGQILEGKTTVEDALDIIILKKVANIQKLVRAGLEPDLAEATLKIRLAKFGKKGANPTPLIDTSQYLNSITGVKVMEKKGAL